MAKRAKTKRREIRVVRYAADPCSQYTDGDARKMGPVLRKEFKKHGDTFTARQLVAVSRNPKSPFHKYIFAETDRTIAWRRREQLAKELMLAIRVVFR